MALDLDFYKEKLLTLKKQILNGGIVNRVDDLHVSSDDLPDEADLANNIINQHIAFSIREKERAKLRMIDEALFRIEEGTYGYCLDCDEEIEEKRLMNQPWTPLCVLHAEERERGIHRKFGT